MIQINEGEFLLADGISYGKIYVLIYSGSGDPKIFLQEEINKLTIDTDYIDLSDTYMNMPWMRTILIGVNKMKITKK